MGYRIHLNAYVSIKSTIIKDKDVYEYHSQVLDFKKDFVILDWFRYNSENGLHETGDSTETIYIEDVDMENIVESYKQLALLQKENKKEELEKMLNDLHIINEFNNYNDGEYIFAEKIKIIEDFLNNDEIGKRFAYGEITGG